ncbi:probable G-protein coupled receptor 179 [Heptranchias perlo]|uniref:probable G-protein coupled receptor 179 n=1 Tax=Heptranchias perlo TaxID=212740 RepID=UPI0035593778
MSMLRVILYIHIGVFGGFGGFQNRKTNPKTRLFRDWNVSQISILVTSPEGNLDKPDPETSEAATYFLYSGDPSKLSQVNCTRRVEVRGMKGEPAVTLHSLVHGAIDTMIHATNFLNMVFQTNDIRESSVKEDIEWYHALVRSILEGDPKIYRAMLTFDVPTIPSKSQLVLQVTRYENEIFLQDLSSTSDYLENQTSESEWFNGLKYQRAPYLNKRILYNDLKTLDTPKWNQGDSYTIDKSHVKWSSPFLDCEDYKLIPRWMMTMSSSFYGLKPDLSPEFKGVIRIDVNLQSVDIDQCSTGNSWFADSHQCDVNSTECTPLKGRGFQLGAYQCVCKKGYYNPNLISTNSFNRQDDKHISYFSRYAVGEPRRLFQCLPCKDGCGSCVSDAPCLTQEDGHLRLAVLSLQAFCMLLVFISMLVVYHFRNNKKIRASGLVLLETILAGSILLYFPVFILYFQPSVFRCVLLRWVRMLGFSINYGTVTLKIYRVLKVFLSRTAQRVPYMTCYRVLKMLGIIMITVCWFLVAWTVAAWENMDRKIPLVIQSQTPDGQTFNMCQLDRWDYMTAIAEFLFLCWGSYLCYTVRTVPSAYHEPRFMGFAIHNEILMSAAFHSVRFSMATTLHPDWMLLLFFAHSHLTVTVTLILLFIPKFIHMGAPLREDIAAEVYEEELDMRCSGSYLNTSITSAWSDHSLDPDDIRDELKRLYAQLEVHKTKKMTANNPHLQKKRSTRRSLGRSIIRRITEIPESMSRRCSRDERGANIGIGSYPGSYRKKLYESSSSSMRVKDDSIKNRFFSIRKSHSTYDHVRDHRDGPISRTNSSSRDPSLLDSMMRKKLAKKASERTDADSLDAAPLVCKSISAHNLTVDNPLHTKATTLHKSLSVLTYAKENTLTLTEKYEENTKQMGDKVQKKHSDKQTPTKLQPSTAAAQSEEANKMSDSVRQQAASELRQGSVRSLLKDDSNKTLVCPWDFQSMRPPPSETTVHKHVSCTPIKSNSVDISHSSGKPNANRKRFAELVKKHRSLHQDSISNVNGWDVKETSTMQREAEVSMDMHRGANTSPRVGKSVESSRTEDIRPGEQEEVTPKAKRTELPSEKIDQVKTDGPMKESKREKYMSLIKQTSTNSAIICPWDVMVEKTSAMGISADQKQGRSLSVCVGTPGSLVNDTLKVKDANNSLLQSKGFGLSLKLLMTPGKMKDSKKEKSGKESEKVKGNKDKEKEKENITEAMHPIDKSTVADICPRETGETKGKEEKSQSRDKSKVADNCPLDTRDTGSKRQRYMSFLKQASTNSAIICPWNINLNETSATDRSADQKKGRSFSVCAGVPGTLVHGTLKTKDADDSLQQPKRFGLPFKFMMASGKTKDREKEKSRKESEKVKGSKGKEKEKENITEAVGPIDKSKVTDKSPLDTGDTGIKQQRYKSLLRQASTNSAISFPSDVMVEETAAMSINADQKQGRSLSFCVGTPGSLVRDTLKTTDTNNLLQQSKGFGMSLKLLMAPGMMKDSKKEKSGKESEKVKGDKGKEKEKIVTEAMRPIDKSTVADICPRETGETKSKEEKSQSRDKSKVADNCPSDTGDKGSKRQKYMSFLKQASTNSTIICPWDIILDETSTTGMNADQTKGRSLSVCAGTPGSLVHGTLKTKNADDSLQQPKRFGLSFKLMMAPGKMMDREIKEERSVSIDKSKVADICPWDTGDTGSRETSLSTDKSKVEDICPWDTGNTGSRETSLSTDKSKVADICPWDTGDTGSRETSLSIDKSKVADICPWDTGDTGSRETSLSTDKSKVADICPWDTGDTGSRETSLSIDKSKVADICPWDTGDTGSRETSLSIDKSKVADICPWDTGDTGSRETSLSIDKSKVADICPWDTGDTGSRETSLSIDKSKVADICPWDTGDTGSRETSLSIDKSKVAVNSPLDTGDTGIKQQRYKSLLRQASTNSAIICPSDVMVEEKSAMSINADQKQGRSLSFCVGTPGSLVRDTLKTTDTNNLLQQSKGFGLSLKLLMAPEKMKDSKKEKSGKESEKVKGNKGKEKEKENITEAMHPIDKSTVADICPWETGETKGKKEKSQTTDKSKVADNSPLNTGDKGSKRQRYMSLLKQTSTNNAIICPWDMILDETSAMGTSADQTKGRTSSVCAATLGSLVHGTLKTKNADDSLQQPKRFGLSFKPTMAPGKVMDRENKEKPLSTDKSKVEDICPWETGDTGSRETALSIDKSKVADICPWDTGDTGSRETSIDKSKVADICPWETGDTGSRETSIDQSKVADICPWDTGDTGSRETSIDKSKVTDICPWDTGDTGSRETSIDQSKVADICPWDTGDTGSRETSIDQSKVTDICPWDTGDTGSRETSIDQSKVADICPWDTGDTGSKEEKSLPIDKSKVANICPWETETSATGESQTGTKAERNLTSISPWDVEGTAANQPENKEAGKPKGREC